MEKNVTSYIAGKKCNCKYGLNLKLLARPIRSFNYNYNYKRPSPKTPKQNKNTLSTHTVSGISCIIAIQCSKRSHR